VNAPSTSSEEDARSTGPEARSEALSRFRLMTRRLAFGVDPAQARGHRSTCRYWRHSSSVSDLVTFRRAMCSRSSTSRAQIRTDDTGSGEARPQTRVMVRRVAKAAGLGGLAAGILGLVARGAVTIDVGLGRTVRPLGLITVRIAAPREVVFDVVSSPYPPNHTRVESKLQVIERGEDMVLATHFTQVGGFVATTLETVRFRATVPGSLPSRARSRSLRRRAVPPPRDRWRNRAGVSRGTWDRFLGARALVGRAGREQMGGSCSGVTRQREDGSGTKSCTGKTARMSRIPA
jgi:hypothetical protein